MTTPLDGIHIIGAGGHGKVAVRAAQACSYRVVAIFDDDPSRTGDTLLGFPIVGNVRSLADSPPRPTLIAIGNNLQRLAIAEKLAVPWVTVVHPAAIIDKSARVGIGVLVLPGAVVQVDATLGDHAIVNDNATVEHDCHVRVAAHIGPNACLCGGASVGMGALVGAGAVVLPGVSIGDFAIVGAGAVVTSDVPANATVVGVPARVIYISSVGSRRTPIHAA